MDIFQGEFDADVLARWVLTRAHPGWLGLRYVGERASFSLSAAPLRAEYEPVEVGTRPFTNLYKDRTWISVQAAWAVEF